VAAGVGDGIRTVEADGMTDLEIIVERVRHYRKALATYEPGSPPWAQVDNLHKQAMEDLMAHPIAKEMEVLMNQVRAEQ